MPKAPPARVALFDVDGTLVDGHVWRGILAYPALPRYRRWLFYADQLAAVFGFRLRLISQARFRETWVRGLARVLKGWSAGQLDDLFAWIADEYLVTRYRADVVGVLRTHKEQGGHVVVLVSTLFEGAIARIAARLGADAGLGTALEMRDGVCTGRIVGESCVGPRKLDAVRAYLRRRAPDLRLEDAAAYADSISDAPLLDAVVYPTAVYPDPQLRALAQARGWPIHP